MSASYVYTYTEEDKLDPNQWQVVYLHLSREL